MRLSRLLVAAPLLTTGCHLFSGKPAYTGDPLLQDRKPVLGIATLTPTLPGPEPAAPPAPPLADSARLTKSAEPDRP